VQETTLDAYGHQDVPFERLVDELNVVRDMSHSPLFQVMFSYQADAQAADQVLSLPDLSIEPFGDEMAHSEKFDMSLFISEQDNSLSGNLSYNPDLFDENTIESFVFHFTRVLEGIVLEPRREIQSIPLLSQSEREQLVQTWNETDFDYPSNKGLTALFAEQVSRTPNKVALSYAGKTLTYEELDSRSSGLAHYLRELGVGPGTPVGLCVERSFEMVIGMYGILKAGGAYVPLEPGYPAERLNYMLEDCGAPVVLAQGDTSSALEAYAGQVVILDELSESLVGYGDGRLLVSQGPEDLAYIIYTSGSTGMPKGVNVAQRGVVSLVYWMHREFGFSESDRMLLKTPFSFDVSVVEFFWPLLVGGCLEIAKPDGHKDPSYLVDVIRERNISLIAFVPSMLSVFLESERVEECSSLRRVAVAGEALGEEIQSKFYERLPWVELDNLYGPTEATVYASYWHCERGGRGIVPIGRPVGNAELYVLDSALEPVPVGVSGELHIGGVGLAGGYLNQPELTAEKFISSPFKVGGRLYKTGDLARFRSDGSIEYLGRIDHQVKVRGFRIELGEIESALNAESIVRAAVVMARGTGVDQRLVAYVVLGEGVEEETALQSFSRSLAGRLPEFMIPGVYVALDSLPLSPNGKVNRKALPEPELQSRGVEYVAPGTPTEKALCEIWCELLPVERVGIHDNFFELGGHSLLAVQLIARIRTSLGKRIPVSTLFSAQTVEELAQVIHQDEAEQEWSPIIRMQSQGSKNPVFAIHSGNTMVVTYAEIARRLGTDQPFYGIEPRGLIEGQEPFDDLYKMAAYYIEKMRQIQSKGPYQLLGHSLGGVVAYEMAQQLVAAGEEVESLILMDSYQPEMMTGLGLAHAENFYDEFIQNSEDISRKEFAAMSEEAFGEFIKPNAMGLFDTEQFVAKLRVLRGFDKMVQQYRLQPYDGDVLLFRAGDMVKLQKELRITDKSAGWSNVVMKGRLEIIEVPGNHEGILRRKNVGTLVAHLKEWLCRENSVIEGDAQNKKDKVKFREEDEYV